MIIRFCFELWGYVHDHYLVVNFFLDPVREIIELSMHRINPVWWRHDKKTAQIQWINQSPFVTAGVLWNPASPHQRGRWGDVVCCSLVFPYWHSKDLRKIRFTENKVHFWRRWAMLRKAEVLWNLGDEETRQYASKRKAAFYPRELY